MSQEKKFISLFGFDALEDFNINEILPLIKSTDLKIPGRKCLIIDDSHFTRIEIRKILERNEIFSSDDILEADDGISGFKKYTENLKNLDIVFCDIQMKNLDGLKFIKMVKDFEKKLEEEGEITTYFFSSTIPIIIMTGTATTEAKLKALELGAKDFIMKPSREITKEDFEKEIILRSKIHISLKRNIGGLASLSIMLKQASIIDPLTGAYNRRYLNEFLPAEASRAMRKGTTLCAVIFDLDNFKEINDKFGHLIGDEVIKDFSTRLKTVKRKYDVLIRYGGDEFLVIMPETRADGAQALFERLKKEYESNLFEHKNLKIHISFSAGCSFFPTEKIKTEEDLLRYADNALYEAKKSGKSCIKFLF